MTTKRGWSLEFYTDARGQSPALNFMTSLQGKERSALLRALDLLLEFGPALPFPHTSHVDGPIWELRAGQGRLFYFAYVERRFVVLHGYYKKSQKAPKREIETAHRRLADFLEQEDNGR
jgi:phage-related protein